MPEQAKFDLPGFDNQEDNTIWIDWGQLGTNDDGTPHDKERTMVVPVGSVFIGTVISINESTAYEGVKIVSWELDDGRIVATLCPASLQDKLGIGKFRKKFTATVGSRTAVKYLGLGKKEKGKNAPHLFEVKFGKPIEPKEEQDTLDK